MNPLNRLERSFGWMAIGHLPIYVVMAQAITFLWTWQNPEAIHLLTLDPWLVLHGRELWRLLTFLFIVPFDNPIWAFFYLYFQYMCGITLEQEWGSFPLTLFYLVGAVGATAAAFLVGNDMSGAFYFNDAVFLAFAALYPNFQLLLFLILPLRVKWIAWFTWARIAWGFFNVPILYKIAILLSLSHYFLFFSRTHFLQLREMIQRYRHRQKYKDFIQ